MSKIIKTIENLKYYFAHKTGKTTSTTMRKTFIQISAVAKVVAKEALAQPISAWPCIRHLNLPPKKRVPFVFSENDYDASSSVIYNLHGAASLRGVGGGGAATRRNVASTTLLHSVFNYLLWHIFGSVHLMLLCSLINHITQNYFQIENREFIKFGQEVAP